jgi:hypothetical protein
VLIASDWWLALWAWAPPAVQGRPRYIWVSLCPLPLVKGVNGVGSTAWFGRIRRRRSRVRAGSSGGAPSRPRPVWRAARVCAPGLRVSTHPSSPCLVLHTLKPPHPPKQTQTNTKLIQTAQPPPSQVYGLLVGLVFVVSISRASLFFAASMRASTRQGSPLTRAALPPRRAR